MDRAWITLIRKVQGRSSIIFVEKSSKAQFKRGIALTSLPKVNSVIASLHKKNILPRTVKQVRLLKAIGTDSGFFQPASGDVPVVVIIVTVPAKARKQLSGL